MGLGGLVSGVVDGAVDGKVAGLLERGWQRTLILTFVIVTDCNSPRPVIQDSELQTVILLWAHQEHEATSFDLVTKHVCRQQQSNHSASRTPTSIPASTFYMNQQPFT